jgi:hypothetical protein
MSVYRSNFTPEKAIVSLATDKTVSLVSKEWLAYLNDAKLIPKHTVYIIDGETTKVYTVDALDKKKNHQRVQRLLLARLPKMSS